MGRYCAVYGCLVTHKNKERRFFRFPADELRCRQWVQVIRRPDLECKDIKTLHDAYFVCDIHFVSSDRLQRKLRSNAVPTLMLPQVDAPDGVTKYTQTDTEIKCPSCNSEIPTSSTSTSRSQWKTDPRSTQVLSQTKRWLRLQQRKECKKRKLMESQTESTAVFGENVSTAVQKLTDTLKNVSPNSLGNRCNKESKMFALNLFLASPLAYRVLSETLRLPNVSTLRRLNIDPSTKFGDDVVNILEWKVRNLSESEKYCIICADEMTLERHLHYQINKDKVIGFHEINEMQTKEIATEAFVVMARGVFSEWEQPLAFCFLKQNKNYAEINSWLEEIIAKMFDIGFNVVAFTSDRGSNFISMGNDKNVTVEQPFFTVNGRKIYYIFDVPQLMNSLRDNLMKYHFLYHDTDGSELVASWDDIEKVYEIEKNKTYKIAHKLTESHIRPNNLEKLQVKYAAQALSRSVAVALSTCIESGKVTDESWGTVKLVEMINDMFDTLNSSSVSDTNKYQILFRIRIAFSQKEYQMSTLGRVQNILSDLRVVNKVNGKDVTKTMKFINGLLITIKSITILASDLKDKGFNFLFTRRLNRDALEGFFGAVRQQAGHCRHPTAIQFYAAFRKMFLVNMIRYSEYENCSADLNRLLVTAEKAKNDLERGSENDSSQILTGLEVGTVDYRFEPPEENAFSYVCGYLLKKCRDNHKDCEEMESYVKQSGQVVDQNVLTYFKADTCDTPFGSLTNPPDDFKEYIKQIDSICVNYFLNHSSYHVGNELMMQINSIPFDPPCSCFPLLYLKKLFLRFRVFNVIRRNNKNFRGKSCRNKYFSVSHL